ncbi:uncharacterized protein BYT42DRAFT_613641 [Radiomyces spectabilis]|uniref:uncharacterized protein n=1 Tax=Radiomyces spectabilis TaxID=64574 RepID=UPI00221FE188|nr:uncharacterized protein BYT42DRAFT_613641 [Radiomyces spectabilis]KAI8379321.1 hypothetical protein BYT42DRAFT_613641 [Radiomyces spectabilis]
MPALNDQSKIDNELKHLFQIPLITDADTADQYYQAHFDRIASAMLLDYDLCIGENRYNMLEVEGYLKTQPEHFHADPFCHGHPLQKRSGAWFFHHVGLSHGFRGGSRKGVDITVGDAKEGSAGGMLIRAIQNESTGQLIEGPSLVVNEILSVLGESSIKNLVESHWHDHPGWSYAEESRFYLAPKKTIHSGVKRKASEFEIYKSPRVGLGLTNHSPSIEMRLSFVNRPYRFVISPWLLKKGRVWTIFNMLETEVDQEDIATLNDTKSNMVAKYKVEYDLGKDLPVETIKSCLKNKDIVHGGAWWKIRVMSAIQWWASQDDPVQFS